MKHIDFKSSGTKVKRSELVDDWSITTSSYVFGRYYGERRRKNYRKVFLACLVCLTPTTMLCLISSKRLESILHNTNSVHVTSIDLPGELVIKTLEWLKNSNSGCREDKKLESGSVTESESRVYYDRGSRNNTYDIRTSLLDSLLNSDKGFLGACKNGLSLCTHKPSDQQRPFEAPDGCVIISTEDLSYVSHSPIKSKSDSIVVSICVPGDIGTVKLNKYSLEKMGLVNFEGKSMVSFLTAGEGMNVAIFTGSDFEGDSYILSGDSRKRRTFLHNWKHSSNDNVQSLIIHSVSTAKLSHTTSFPLSPRSCDCIEDAGDW